MRKADHSRLLALHGTSELDDIMELVAPVAGASDSGHDSFASLTIEGTDDQLPSVCVRSFLGARISLTGIHFSTLRLNIRLQTPTMVAVLLHEARPLARGLYAWGDGLPQELQYSDTAPLHIFELQ